MEQSFGVKSIMISRYINHLYSEFVTTEYIPLKLLGNRGVWQRKNKKKKKTLKRSYILFRFTLLLHRDIFYI
jgi:hypothetical protein